MIQIQGYDNPTTYEWMLKKSEQTESRGYPNKWGDDSNHAHWGPYGHYAPTMRVEVNEPNGLRVIHHLTRNTSTYEYPDGTHIAYLNDAMVENIARRKMSFVGGGGHSETITGHHDVSRTQGHYRENNAHDTYMHTNGVSHTFSGQGEVGIAMGNKHQECYGHYKIRCMTAGKGFGVGFGPGDGNEHDSNFTMTDKRIYQRTTQNGDIWQDAASNTINHQAGTNHNTQAEENVSIHAKGDHVVVKSGNIYLTGKVQIKGDLLVDGNIQMTSANTPTMYITNLFTTSGGSGGGSAPNINPPEPAALNHGKVS